MMCLILFIGKLFDTNEVWAESQVFFICIHLKHMQLIILSNSYHNFKLTVVTNTGHLFSISAALHQLK